ncbi:nickel ABC transporter substrate-binding protein [Enterococcus villorum]|uniref:Nickel ABC transporter substrate-binding protein n=1 Tax=Enterococcus villorum TaxID=112904 RepID=A0A1V8Y9G3_9ENTE|nr:ABC transporter substrate-binding protein [Enterococcus villorum]OQO69264.1 nickel ABC transporter substrate-binding protein [Enterococcus villorum]OQO73739.1 nickel ABC transporter substrate-binding protein [Enterococcus villorum]
MRKKTCLIILLLVISVLTACTNKKLELSSEKDSKTVTIAIASEGKGEYLDATSYNSAMALYGAVYESLITYAGQGTYKPGLAQRWEQSEDGKTYTFYLKKHQKFSNGTEVTADAVKFTLERAKFLNEMSTLQTLTNLETIHIPDEYTVELVFNQVSNQLLAELCQTRPLRIMSPDSVDTKKYDGKFKKAIGSGALCVEKSTDEQTIMTPNPYYRQNHPIDYQVIFQTIPDASSRFLAMKSGKVDIVGGTLGDLSTSDKDILAKDPMFNSYDFAGTMTHFMAFNPGNEQLSQPIREGIATAINTAKLSDKKLKGLFQETVQYVNQANQSAKIYDVEKAKALFEKDGYQLNTAGYYEKNNIPLAFNLVIQTTEFPEWKEKAELIEQYLKQVGVSVSIQIVDQESYYDRLWKTKKYDLIFYRTYTDALLPYYFLHSLFENQKEQSGILANDGVLTDLLKIYAKTSDKTKQQEIFQSIFKRIADQSLAVPIDYKDECFVTSKKITGFTYSGLSDAPIDFSHLTVA